MQYFDRYIFLFCLQAKVKKCLHNRSMDPVTIQTFKNVCEISICSFKTMLADEDT